MAVILPILQRRLSSTRLGELVFQRISMNSATYVECFHLKL